MLQVMGPSSLASGVHSEAGSHSLGSELGRTYEDEDTWYDFSHAYAAGPDTYLAPETDSGLNVFLSHIGAVCILKNFMVFRSVSPYDVIPTSLGTFKQFPA